jgi:predicted dehydrogenase
MKSEPIVPVLVGRGMAGQAILKSLAFLAQSDPELNLLPVRQAYRGIPLGSYVSENACNVLFLASPSGLHAQSILEGERAGFSMIATDKPVCVLSEELSLLLDVHVPVSVFHGYRVMWGTKTIKHMIEAGELGEIFAFESRYWQSSSAQAALKGTPEKRLWKNDRQLNGPFDVLTDLGSHVADICLYLMADTPIESNCTLSYWNSIAPHRDSQVYLSLKFTGNKRALASISKTVHGATNNFEYTVMGTRGSATWKFLQPDEVECGFGNRTTIIRRDAANSSSRTAPFHGMGWLEGYIEITQQTLRQAAGLSSACVPTLKEALAAMDVLLNANRI